MARCLLHVLRESFWMDWEWVKLISLPGCIAPVQRCKFGSSGEVGLERMDVFGVRVAAGVRMLRGFWGGKGSSWVGEHTGRDRFALLGF